jgi:hypothetical protein
MECEDDPPYQNFTEIGVPCICTCFFVGMFDSFRSLIYGRDEGHCDKCAHDKDLCEQHRNRICLGMTLDIFSLMVVIALAQQFQNNFSDGLSTASYVFTLASEFLICMICLSESYPSLGNCLPKWIFTKLAQEPMQEMIPVDSVASAKSSPPFSPFSVNLWEYSVPFLVFFRNTFSPQTRVFNHKIPAAFSPALLIVRSVSNILVIVSTLIFRYQGMLYNAKMFNLSEPKWSLDFDPELFQSPSGEATEIGICKSLSIPKPKPMINSPVVQWNHEIIHTPMLLNLFIVFYMALSLKSFALTRTFVKTLQNVGLELKRHKIKYHNGDNHQESAYSLWRAINHVWIVEIISSKDFLSQMMGFQDLELDYSMGTIKPKANNVKSHPEKRLLILSLVPLLMAFIIPFQYALLRNPESAKILGIPCPAQACLNLFSVSVIGKCETARNTTVWTMGHYNCFKCDILVHGSFNQAAHAVIQLFSKFHAAMNPFSFLTLVFQLLSPHFVQLMWRCIALV